MVCYSIKIRDDLVNGSWGGAIKFERFSSCQKNGLVNLPEDQLWGGRGYGMSDKMRGASVRIKNC